MDIRIFPVNRYRKSILILVGILMLPGVWSSSAEAQLTAEQLVGQAVSLSNKKIPDIDSAIKRFENRDIEGAHAFLVRASEKNPDLPPPDVTLAKMHIIANQGGPARTRLEQAVIEYPDDPEAYLLFADFAFRANRVTEAEALFEVSRELVNKFNSNERRKKNFQIRVMAGRSAVAERRQQWEKAQERLEEWVKFDPESAAGQQRLGVVKYRMGDPRGAFAQFTKARELDSAVPHPYVRLGILFSADGEHEKARKAFEQAYSENKDDVAVCEAYADWLIQRRKLDKAMEVTDELLKKDPNSKNALMLSGVISMLGEDIERSKEDLGKILTLDPSNSTATNWLALLLADSPEESDLELAFGYARNNAQRFQKSAQALITMAWVLQQQGREQEALQLVSQGANQGNVNLDSVYYIARILAAQDKKDQAIRTLKQALDQNGRFLFRPKAQELLDKLENE